MFTEAATKAGYHPFPRPTANASQPYTNPDGAKYGACQYCGYCQQFGCEANAKGSPHIAVIPFALRNPNFELRTHSWVTKVLKDSDGKRVTGVTYTNVLNGEEFEQPAGIVLLCAYALNNVHLMLLSGIGQPYDPAAQTGVIGRNYCYQTGTGAQLFFDNRRFNPFMAGGGTNVTFDDFNVNWAFDRGPHGFVGGYNVSSAHNTGAPIAYRPLPRGTPQWGTEWKKARVKWYQGAMNIGASGSVMANRANFLDLDPTYRNAFGQPLMRMTFDYKDNEHKLGRHAAKVVNDLAKAMSPTHLNEAGVRQSWTVVPYQSTHNTGGTIMGASPRDSAVNRYLQSWDCHNLFTVGANVFPHNSSYNPTGPVGALTYWLVDAIKNRYLKNPGPLVQA
jgi:gluconate 2-dehydrogenase alpha chain